MIDAEISDRPTPARWGTLGTILWGLLLAGVYMVAGTVAYVAVIGYRNPEAGSDQLQRLFEETGDDGFVLAISSLAVAVVVLPLLVGAVKLKRGAEFRDYLALVPVPPKMILKWIIIALLAAFLFDAGKWLLGLPLVPEFGLDTYRTMGVAWVFFPAVVIVAPVLEEAFFRGFMMSGLERGFLGARGAVIVTAAVWAAIHVQYELYDVAWIFVLGCILGTSRLLTGSIYPAVAAHVVMNLVAYGGVAVYVERLSVAP